MLMRSDQLEQIAADFESEAGTSTTGQNDTGRWKRIEHAGADYSAFTALRFNGYPGINFPGVIVPVAILDTAAGDYAATLTHARTWASELKTELGL